MIWLQKCRWYCSAHGTDTLDERQPIFKSYNQQERVSRRFDRGNETSECN